MRMYAVADDRDTLTGLRLAGIEGSFAEEKRDIQALIDGVRADAGVAVLIITESCAALVPETVRELKLSGTNPLLVVVPGSRGSSREADSITALIREAIGIKI
jgi:V/A-type H+-transporting ATPase subunit F